MSTDPDASAASEVRTDGAMPSMPTGSDYQRTNFDTGNDTANTWNVERQGAEEHGAQQFPGAYNENAGPVEKVCIFISNCLFKATVQWHTLPREARRAYLRRCLSVFVVVAGLVSLGMGVGYRAKANEDAYDHQHDAIVQFVESWNTKYQEHAAQLDFLVGETGSNVHEIKHEVPLLKKHNDDMRDTYPYATALLEQHHYKPISYVNFQMGPIIQKSQNSDVVWSKSNPIEYNITTSLSYQVLKHGSAEQIIHQVEGIPIIQKKYEKLESPQDCGYRFHGLHNATSGKCLYYLQTRKICLVVDQDSADYRLVNGYEDFRCNYLNYGVGYTMSSYLIWHHNDSEPTLENIATSRLTLEVMMSEEPHVKTVRSIDILHFELMPGNYRLESVLCFSFAACSVVATVFLCTCRESAFRHVAANEREQLKALEGSDAEFKQLRDRRRALEELKRKHRKAEIDQIAARDMMRKMMLNSNAHFNTNTNSQSHTVTSEFNYDVELQDQAYGALARASDISVLSDASADAYGMNSSQQQLRGANTLYSLATGPDDPDLDLSGLSSGYVDQGIEAYQYYSPAPASNPAYKLAKDTSWSFAQDSQDPSI
jgi:hypothetical protein